MSKIICFFIGHDPTLLRAYAGLIDFKCKRCGKISLNATEYEMILEEKGWLKFKKPKVKETWKH